MIRTSLSLRNRRLGRRRGFSFKCLRKLPKKYCVWYVGFLEEVEGVSREK